MVRIALVGTGGMGTVHFSNYAHLEGCQVVAIVGNTQQSEEFAAQWNLPIYENIPEMAKSEQVDVVDVCTPTYLHKQHVMEALSRGMHAITEKPVALSHQDAVEMWDLADQVGKHIYVAQVLQFTKEVEVLHNLVNSGKYGKPLDAHFERLAACPTWAKDGWLFDKNKSGLLPFDLHVHDLDIIVSLFGKPESVEFTSCGGADKRYKEHYRFLYGYGDLHVAAEAAWFNSDFPFTARWRVYFENAVVVNDGSKVVAYPAGEESTIFNTEDEMKIPTGINLPPTGMFYHELSHFMDCIEKGIPSDKVTQEQVLAVVEVLEQIVAQEDVD